MDIEKIRQGIPGLKNVVHFNNAGASLISKKVLDTQIAYLRTEALHGGYETAAKYSEELDGFYHAIAELINANPDEIAFTESATVAWQRAFFSIPFQSGDNIITCESEYASNYISLLRLKEDKQVEIRIVGSTDAGEVDLEKLEEIIDNNTRLIAITHMPTNSGLVNPAEEIGKIANKHNILYLLDACQSIGHYPIDIEKVGCHFLSATGRKYLRGPRGTGFLFVKSSALKSLSPLSLDLHSAELEDPEHYHMREDAKRFETWETSQAGKIGLARAVSDLNKLGMDNVWSRISQLAAYLRSNLSKIEGVELTDIGNIKSGIVTFTSAIEVDKLKQLLSDHGFNTVISRKSSTLLDMSERNLEKVIRVSLHYYNTEKEIDLFVSTLQGLLRS